MKHFNIHIKVEPETVKNSAVYTILSGSEYICDGFEWLEAMEALVDYIREHTTDIDSGHK